MCMVILVGSSFFARVFCTSKITIIVESTSSFFPSPSPYMHDFFIQQFLLEIGNRPFRLPSIKNNAPSLTIENRIEEVGEEGVVKACGSVENTALLLCMVLMLQSMTSRLKRNLVCLTKVQEKKLLGPQS